MVAPLIGAAAIGAAAQIAGSVYQNYQSRKEASRNRSFQRENMEYQMSHAHQSEVEDLRRAGLNPILSATGGGASASSMPGAMASFSNPAEGFDLANPIANATRISEVEKERVELERRALESQSHLNDANSRAAEASALSLLESAKTQQTQQLVNNATVAKINADATLTPFHRAALAAQALEAEQRAHLNNASTLLTREQFIMEQIAAATETEAKNKGLTWFDRLLDTASKGTGVLSGARGVFEQSRVRQSTGRRHP